MGQRPTIGVLVPYVGGSYFTGLLHGIQRSVRARAGCVVAFQTTNLDVLWPTEEDTLPLGWSRIDGWLGVHDLLGAPLYERLTRAQKPLVTLSARPRPDTCTVMPDNRGAMRDAVRHLIDHGHRRIAFAGPLNHNDVRERYEGYVAALREAGIAVDPSLFLPMASTQEGDGREVGKYLISTGLPCTAVIAGTDSSAIGLMTEVQKAGYRIPGDLAVVGFNDVARAQDTDPPLATIRLSLDAMATHATEILLAHLLDGVPLPEGVRIPAQFVARPSCGCIGVPDPVGSAIPPGELAAGLPEAIARALGSAPSETAVIASAASVVATWAQSLADETMVGKASPDAPAANLSKAADVATTSQAVRDAWRTLFTVAHDVETVETVLSLLDRAIADRIGSKVPIDPERAEIARRRMRRELLGAWRGAYERARGRSETYAETSRKIDLALIGADITSAQELEWLRWASVRYACLGDWAPATSQTPRRLTVRSLFSPHGELSNPVGSMHCPADFPSAELCDLVGQSSGDDILSILPITGRGANRGLLALIGPIEAGAGDDTGSHAQWAALLGAAMDREELVRSLRQNALYDTLTGLPNRALLIDRLEQAIARAQRANSRFAVLFLDLDRFKTINDSLGHTAGDQLLTQIAERLGAIVRATDTIARLGGDEFAIIVTDLANEEAAFFVADRLQEALRAPFDVGAHRVFTSASVGITISSDRYQEADDFLRDADTAMYRAKSQGRAHHQLFDGHMHKQAMERLSVEAGLRRALERDEFILHYQPLVSLGTGEIVGVEALIRWQHPERGLLPPIAFLPIAEESGLILAISEWVMRAACEQGSQWQRELASPMRISVNVPPQQLKDARFVEQVREVLRRTGFVPSALGLELVESSLVETGSMIITNLIELRQMGIAISIDDFGTGYSSLSYLKRLPIDSLKIDRSFTLGIPNDPNDTAISSTIIAMARSLKLNVVAEGVETREQAEYLREHECQCAQGYLFSRPLPADDCLAFFRQTRALVARSFSSPPTKGDAPPRPAVVPPLP